MRKSSKLSTVSGQVAAPTSKSALQRCIAAASLANGSTTLRHISLCNDSRAALHLAACLGAAIKLQENTLLITGGGEPCCQTLHCGESGLALRMFAALAARFAMEFQLTGEQTLLRRPVDMLVAPLQQLGASCRTTDGHLPLWIRGPLRGGRAEVEGSVSSQLLTGLLLVLPTLPVSSELLVHDLRSRPYIDLTIAILQEFGITVTHQGYEHFYIEGNQRYRPVDITVEGDWSGAAFLLVAAALRGEVTVSGLNPTSTQADRRIIEVLERCGAKLEIQAQTLTVRQDNLRAFDFDATDCPDLFPPLVALATGCRGVSRIKGVPRLIHKESNRAQALVTEFGRLGIDIRIDGDTMSVTGSQIKGGLVEAHQDHRIAMALALAGLCSSQPVIISGAECVAKSYPAFFEALKQIGGIIDE